MSHYKILKEGSLKNTDKKIITDPEAREIIFRLARYFKDYKLILIVTLIATVFVSLVDSSVIFATTMVIELFSAIGHAIATNTTINHTFSRVVIGIELWNFSIKGSDGALRVLWLLSGFAVGLVIVKGGIHFIKELLLWKTTHRILMRLKEQLFNRIVLFPLSTFDREKSGEMLSRITFDVTQLENAIRTGILLIKSFIEAIIFVSILFLINWELALMGVCVFPISAMMIKLFGESIRRFSGAMSVNVADYTSFLSEAITGAKVIKAFGRERAKQKKFKTKILLNFNHAMNIAKVDAVHSPIQEFISTTGMVAVMVFCGHRLAAGSMTLGDLMAFIGMLVLAYKPIKKLGNTNTIIQRAIASGSQIFRLLDMPDEAEIIGTGSQKPSPVQGELNFRNVKFSYFDNVPVLRGINLKINAGETIALVGPSGGGKSTTISLIPRFYPIDNGSIELDSVDIANFDVAYLRSLISIVPQETILFAGTVEENIRFSKPDATNAEIEDAAKAANAHAFIIGLPDKYETEVGERGVQLSGGQRQRIAIARAVLRDPRILLLDEATSSLDTESERLIQDALEKIRQNRTTIIIAHRLSTIQSADRIAVIVEGELAEIGSHKELYTKDGVYRKLHEMQFSS